MAKECLAIPARSVFREGLVWPVPDDGNYSYIPMNSLGRLRRVVRIVQREGQMRKRSGPHNVENDETQLQPIMYAHFRRPDGKFLLYQRATNKNYSESALAGKVSVGLGGHIDSIEEGLGHSLYRELEEEAEFIDEKGNSLKFRLNDGSLDLKSMKRYMEIVPTGLIYDPRDDVGKVHLGISCNVELREGVQISVRTGDKDENVNAWWVGIEEYNRLVDQRIIQPEGWTSIVVKHEIEN